VSNNSVKPNHVNIRGLLVEGVLLVEGAVEDVGSFLNFR
ncbi:MAG: hypothetical protein ACI8SA_001467, partial [Dokdonia sp.]